MPVTSFVLSGAAVECMMPPDMDPSAKCNQVVELLHLNEALSKSFRKVIGSSSDLARAKTFRMSNKSSTSSDVAKLICSIHFCATLHGHLLL